MSRIYMPLVHDGKYKQFMIRIYHRLPSSPTGESLYPCEIFSAEGRHLTSFAAYTQEVALSRAQEKCDRYADLRESIGRG